MIKCLIKGVKKYMNKSVDIIEDGVNKLLKGSYEELNDLGNLMVFIGIFGGVFGGLGMKIYANTKR